MMASLMDGCYITPSILQAILKEKVSHMKSDIFSNFWSHNIFDLKVMNFGQVTHDLHQQLFLRFTSTNKTTARSYFSTLQI